MKSRAELPALLLTYGLTGTLVEVGTYQGEYAEAILQHWPGTVVCVDAWQHFPSVADCLNHDQATLDHCYRTTLERLRPYEHRCEVHRLLSVDAAAQFTAEGRTFDAVYLDAGHDRANIEADIAAWYPLVKSGGLFAGHDYLDKRASDGWPADFDVKPVVDAFVATHGLPLHVTDEPFPTWWTVKP